MGILNVKNQSSKGIIIIIKETAMCSHTKRKVKSYFGIKVISKLKKWQSTKVQNTILELKWSFKTFFSILPS